MVYCVTHLSLGGEDFDLRLMNYVIEEFCKANNVQPQDVRKNKRRMHRLRIECQEVKHVLSEVSVVRIQEHQTVLNQAARGMVREFVRWNGFWIAHHSIEVRITDGGLIQQMHGARRQAHEGNENDSRGHR